MKSPEFKYKSFGSNGWAIYEGQFIKGKGIRNMHIVEGVVRKDDKGDVRFSPNPELKTMCGNQTLVQGKRTCWLATEDAAEIRVEAARLENGSAEVCGQCVACFYADDNK